MQNFQVHTIESAPANSKSALEGLKKNFGLVPNLAATMAESPTLVNGFVGALVNFIGGTLTGAERQVVLLASAVYNQCAWAVAFHSTAAAGEGVAASELDAIRAGGLPADRKYAALTAHVRSLYGKRGALASDELAAFAAAGYTPAQALEVIAGLGASMMANFAGNITNPPLEEPFRAHAWNPRAAR
jgi:AhpD family alkylhydroperoxidase